MIKRALDERLREAADRFGTPSFVYFTQGIDARIAELREGFGRRLTLSFAVKCNPNPALLAWLGSRIEHLDISSVGELRLARRAGWDAERISFTGPGKREVEIREAIEAGLGLLVVESLREARLADAIARSQGRVQAVVLRIAPDKVPQGFGDQMAGRPCPFGIDLEDADAAIAEVQAMSGLRIKGFHIYSGTQCLKSAAVAENYGHYLSIFERLCTAHGIAPETLILGSGLGVPYHPGDVPLDLAAVADATVPKIDALRAQPAFARAEFMLELGRYLVSESGYFLTRVVSTKTSRGTRIAVCDGGMNNHLPASGHFGMVVRRNYTMHKVGGGAGSEPVTVVGPLCTSIDRLASGVELPPLGEGDIIAVHNSGGYGLTASPIHFISHAAPSEVLVSGDTMRDVSRRFETPLADMADEPAAGKEPACPVCAVPARPWIAMPLDAKKDEPTSFGTVARCPECGLGMATPMPSADEVPQFYDLETYYTHGESHMRPARDTLLDRVLIKLAWTVDRPRPFDAAEIVRLLPPGGTVLDVGCGHGELLEELRDRGIDAIGVDPDPRSRELAATKGLTVVQGTAENPPPELARRRFDLVVMSHSLEHCIDPAAALQALAGYLKPGGHAYVEVPNAGCRHFLTFRQCSEMFDAPRHLWFFTGDALSGLAAKAGLRLERWHYNGFTRLFSRSWRNWESEIYDRLARRNLAATARKHTWWRSLMLLVRSAAARPAAKYDSIGVLLSAGAPR